MSKPVETLDKNSLAYKAKKFLQIHKGNENDLQVVFGGHLFWFPTKFSSDAKILDIKFATQSLRIFTTIQQECCRHCENVKVF